MLRGQEGIYSSSPRASDSCFLDEINELTQHHLDHSMEFARMYATFFPNAHPAARLTDVPFIPVGVFKSLDLKSIPDEEIHRVLYSSGTSGNRSKIYLDRQTADAQASSLRSIMRFWLGSRRPMLIVDSPELLRGSAGNTARAAAVLGMMPFGRQHHWLLDERGNVDLEGLRQWLDAYSKEPLFVFGFTFMVWRHLISELASADLDLSHATLFHGGGWKKLLDSAVTALEFREAAKNVLGLHEIHDYYGMIEQLGTIFVEGADGVVVPPSSATAIIRDPETLEVVPDGVPGLIQLISSVPRSYPGHSILTEDLGRIVPNRFRVGEIGPMGLEILGRIPSAPPRGCSDAIAGH